MNEKRDLEKKLKEYLNNFIVFLCLTDLSKVLVACFAIFRVSSIFLILIFFSIQTIINTIGKFVSLPRNLYIILSRMNNGSRAGGLSQETRSIL